LLQLVLIDDEMAKDLEKVMNDRGKQTEGRSTDDATSMYERPKIGEIIGMDKVIVKIWCGVCRKNYTQRAGQPPADCLLFFAGFCEFTVIPHFITRSSLRNTPIHVTIRRLRIRNFCACRQWPARAARAATHRRFLLLLLLLLMMMTTTMILLVPLLLLPLLPPPQL